MPATLTDKDKKFLADIQNEDDNVKLAAWTSAAEMSPAIIEPLCELLVHDDMRIAKAADEALEEITHSVGKELSGPKWKAVTGEYLRVAERDYPELPREKALDHIWMKSIALRHLSLIGDDKAVKAAAKWLDDLDLREEAIFCIQRIPGEAATEALVKALKECPEDFKPRILAALGQRADPAAANATAAEISNNNTEIAIAAMDATARIGVKPSIDVSPPEFESLSYRNKKAFIDALLRYFDSQAQQGEVEDAVNVFKGVLNQAEDEHLRSAAIVSLSKVGNAEARNAIKAALEDEAYIVRITAEKALEKLG